MMMKKYLLLSLLLVVGIQSTGIVSAQENTLFVSVQKQLQQYVSSIIPTCYKDDPRGSSSEVKPLSCMPSQEEDQSTILSQSKNLDLLMSALHDKFDTAYTIITWPIEQSTLYVEKSHMSLLTDADELMVEFQLTHTIQSAKKKKRKLYEDTDKISAVLQNYFEQKGYMRTSGVKKYSMLPYINRTAWSKGEEVCVSSFYMLDVDVDQIGLSLMCTKNIQRDAERLEKYRPMLQTASEMHNPMGGYELVYEDQDMAILTFYGDMPAGGYLVIDRKQKKVIHWYEEAQGNSEVPTCIQAEHHPLLKKLYASCLKQE